MTHPGTQTHLEVLATGPATTVQDLGRPGHAGVGVGTSGAADRPALRLANRLVGNDERLAALELTLGGLALRAAPGSGGSTVVALTGATAPLAIDGRAVDTHRALVVPDGGELRVGAPERGLHSYLAVRGGLEPPVVLGSRSRDVLAGLGPDAPAVGDVLAVGADRPTVPALDVAPTRTLPAAGEEVRLRVVLGPRDDWFTPDALATLLAASWEVSPRTNRVGAVLDGPVLERRAEYRSAELPSEGVVRGSLQVPPDGRPTLFLADHPVTGGYPVIAVVVDADTDLAGQLRPGVRVALRVDHRPPGVS